MSSSSSPSFVNIFQDKRTLVERAFTIPNTQRIIKFACNSPALLPRFCYVSSTFQEVMIEHETLHIATKNLLSMKELEHFCEYIDRGHINGMHVPIDKYREFAFSNAGRIKNLFGRSLRHNFKHIVEQLLCIVPKKESDSHNDDDDTENQQLAAAIERRRLLIKLLFHPVNSTPLFDAAKVSPHLFRRMLETLDDLGQIPKYLQFDQTARTSFLAMLVRHDPQPSSMRIFFEYFTDETKMMKMPLEKLFMEGEAQQRNHNPRRSPSPSFGADASLREACENNLNAQSLKILIEEGLKKVNADFWKKLLTQLHPPFEADVLMVGVMNNLNVESLRILLNEMDEIGVLKTSLKRGRYHLGNSNLMNYACTRKLNFESLQLRGDTMEKHDDALSLALAPLIRHDNIVINIVMQAFLFMKDVRCVNYLILKYRQYGAHSERVALALRTTTEFRRDCLMHVICTSRKPNSTFSSDKFALLLDL